MNCTYRETSSSLPLSNSWRKDISNQEPAPGRLSPTHCPTRCCNSIVRGRMEAANYRQEGRCCSAFRKSLSQRRTQSFAMLPFVTDCLRSMNCLSIFGDDYWLNIAEWLQPKLRFMVTPPDFEACAKPLGL